MDRKFLLAAEIYSYSYDNYADHIPVENLRFTKYMPENALALENADNKNWSDERIAKKLEVTLEYAKELRTAYKKAVQIVDAENAAQSFREGVKQSIEYSLEEGLKSDGEIEKLVTQICYRAADLSYLLSLEGKELFEYSSELRRKKDNSKI